MGRTERAFVLGSIAFLLALTSAGAAAAPAGSVAASPPSLLLSESPAAFAERAAGQAPGLRAEGTFRQGLELMVLVATCGIVVALYSAMDAGRGGKRVLMRIRRR